MKRFIYITALVSLLLAAALGVLVSAAGGGGGGGGEGGGGGGGSSGGGGGGAALQSDEIVNAQCADDGSIRFTIKNFSAITVLHEATNQSIALKGKWEGNENTEFRSDEALFVLPGEYVLWSKATKKVRVNCPGLVFACSLIAFENVSCMLTPEALIAGVRVRNDSNLSNLKLNFHTSAGIFSYTDKSSSSIFKGISVSQKGEDISWTLAGKHDDFLSFEVIHQLCIGKRYLYARTNCTSQGAALSTSVSSPAVSPKGLAIEPQQLKCGGLLDIADRVRCRINLESEQKEYENFYPEECRNHKAPDACYALYRAVASCWDLPSYQQREACLAKNVGLSSAQKACADEVCRREEHDKRLAMIKLRFYNLEEQAEILEKRGLLGKEALISFVVFAEETKKAVNAARTKAEIEQQIRNAQQRWSALMKEVKKK